MYFFDYGNAFLLTAKRAGMKFEFIIFMSKTFCFSGAPVGGSDDSHCIRFKYPSYVQDIMGDIFSLGFGPFRFVRNKKKNLFVISVLDGFVHRVWLRIYKRQIRLPKMLLKNLCQRKIVSIEFSF
jgi:hypothetical protein